MPNSLSAFPVRDIFDTIMGTDGVMDEVAVAGDTGVSVQPPAGETWIISTATCWGDGSNAGFVSLYDGALRADYLLHPGVGIGEGNDQYSCFRDGKVFIDNSTYLYFYNDHASTRPICYSGEKWPTIPSRGIKADVIQVAAFGTTWIIPPAGEVWSITAITARPSAGIPACAGLDDGGGSSTGILLAPTLNIGEGGTDYSCSRAGKLMISDDLRLYLSNHQAGTQNVSYSGVQWK